MCWNTLECVESVGKCWNGLECVGMSWLDCVGVLVCCSVRMCWSLLECVSGFIAQPDLQFYEF